MIRVAMADDHPVVRAGLQALLDAQPDMSVESFATAEDLVAADLGADVVLIDLRFGAGRMGGAEATRQLLARGGPPVLVLTTYDSDADIVTAVEAGAIGYLLKDAPTDELTAAIRAAAAGRTALGPTVQQRLIERVLTPGTSLTPRELEVLDLVADGSSNEAVARTLHVSLATVKTHLAHVFDKLGVDSRTAAVAVARQRGLIDGR